MEKKYGSLSELITNRNILLKEFFSKRGLDAILIGDYNQPAIVIRSEPSLFAVGGFVKNFQYNFTNIPFGGHVIMSINLNSENEDFTSVDILNIFDEYDQRPVYVLKNEANSMLLFSSITDKSDESHIYWSETDPRYFLSFEKAEEIRAQLLDEYQTKVVITSCL